MSDSQIQVSVICNVYNHGAYIRDALEGFVMQKTSFPFEVLVHDDASTDNSADIIREYEEKYPDLIKPIYQKVNQYSQKIRYTDIYQKPRAKGKYIAMCEGDDYWTDPLKLQKQFDFMEANPDYTLCVCSTVWFNIKTGHKENRGEVKQDRDVSLEEIILEKKGRIFQYATVFMPRDLWLAYPEWGKQFPIGDYPLTLHCAIHGKVRMLADSMAVYRFYAANSFTVRMDNDEARARVSRRMIEGLYAFDEATEHRYTQTVQKRINRHKYTLALMEHDYAMIRSDELRELYQARSPLLKISDWLRCKHPMMYAKVMKPIARILKSYGQQ